MLTGLPSLRIEARGPRNEPWIVYEEDAVADSKPSGPEDAAAYQNPKPTIEGPAGVLRNTQ